MSCRASYRWYVQFEAIAIAIGFIVPVLEACFVHGMTLRWFLLDWLFSTVYANCIGLPNFFFMPRLWERSLHWRPMRRWSAIGGTVVATSVIGCLVAGLLPWAIFRGSYGFWSSYSSSLTLSILISAVMTGVIGTYEQLQAKLRNRELELKTKELEREKALKAATNARLASLESRIHPHFLFNTINSVSSLIHDDPAAAERLLGQMADLLRFSLDSAQTGLVPLERELQVTEDYLAIEKARFGDRLCYQIDVTPVLRDVCVPPLSLQTLVENSIKYAVGPQRQGATVRISGLLDESKVKLSVVDDGPGFSEQSLPQAHGLSNLQERLNTLFGDDATLNITSRPGLTTVSLILPVVAARHSVGQDGILRADYQSALDN